MFPRKRGRNIIGPSVGTLSHGILQLSFCWNVGSPSYSLADFYDLPDSFHLFHFFTLGGNHSQSPSPWVPFTLEQPKSELGGSGEQPGQTPFSSVKGARHDRGCGCDLVLWLQDKRRTQGRPRAGGRDAEVVLHPGPQGNIWGHLGWLPVKIYNNNNCKRWILLHTKSTSVNLTYQ